MAATPSRCPSTLSGTCFNARNFEISSPPATVTIGPCINMHFYNSVIVLAIHRRVSRPRECKMNYRHPCSETERKLICTGNVVISVSLIVTYSERLLKHHRFHYDQCRRMNLRRLNYHHAQHERQLRCRTTTVLQCPCVPSTHLHLVVIDRTLSALRAALTKIVRLYLRVLIV